MKYELFRMNNNNFTYNINVNQNLNMNNIKLNNIGNIRNMNLQNSNIMYQSQIINPRMINLQSMNQIYNKEQYYKNQQCYCYGCLNNINNINCGKCISCKENILNYTNQNICLMRRCMIQQNQSISNKNVIIKPPIIQQNSIKNKIKLKHCLYCFAKGCKNEAKENSKYCSEECGYNTNFE